MKYRIDEAGSVVRVRARSSVHDTVTEWKRLSGHVECDPKDLQSGASADLVVNMAEFDAGDWLKNRKLKKDLDVSRYPSARFVLKNLRDVEGTTEVRAKAEGTIDWRDHVVDIVASGTATVNDSSIIAHASFELDVRELGVKPPRFLMLKVEDVVTVDVTLEAVAQ